MDVFGKRRWKLGLRGLQELKRPRAGGALRLALALALATASMGCGSAKDGNSSSTKGGGGETGGANQSGTGASGAGDGAAPGSGGLGGSEVEPVDRQLVAYGANRTVGLEWSRAPEATGYRIYWSTAPDVDPDSADSFDAPAPGVVHRGLENGTTYHYIVTVLEGGEESAPSLEAFATPGGEWALEDLGTGQFDDVMTGGLAAVPMHERQHLLLFPEGYTEEDLGIFRGDPADGSDRDNDVDRWIDQVFDIEPYSLFREAFVIWYLPRASATRINGQVPGGSTTAPDTAFAVPVSGSGSSWQTASISATGETAARAWEAVLEHPFPPTDFSGGGLGTVRNFTAAFLILHPTQLRAALSGRALALRNPDASNQRLSSGFGIGHAHEFTHAFSGVRDEYMEEAFRDRTWQNSPTTNVVGTNSCGEVPWAHLLEGAGINTTPELVGAFGVEGIGFHAELLCLMNGNHHNGTYYARGDEGSCQSNQCTLRVDGRMCNHCREITAYRIVQRSGLIEGHQEWVSDYRSAFYERFGFLVPELVPQSNDPRHPERGTTIYEACEAALASVDVQPLADTFAGPGVPAEPYEGCVLVGP